MSSDTLCVVPWSSLVVEPDGCAKFCCDAPELLEVDGRIGRLGLDTLDDLWNSEGLVGTRAAMARGDRPAACRSCWEKEDRGVTSRRAVYNGIYERSGGELSIPALAEVGADTGYRLERAPDWFVVELGSVCNLRCRSCGPLSSSRIAADPLHSFWSEQIHGLNRDLLASEHRRAPSAASEGTWFTDVDMLADGIAAGAQGSAMLSLMGGEPFLIKQTWQLLQGLVDRGVAGNIHAGLSTNGQFLSRRVAELAPHFRGFTLSISIDGYGRLYEYLRHGASWSRLVANLDALGRIPGVGLAITPTLQNANVLDIVRLVGFLDELELFLSYNAVDHPARLRPTNLPRSIRDRAAARIREYLALRAHPRNAAVLEAYCERLEAPEPAFDPELFDEFLQFTAEMDASRGESIRAAAPELARLLKEESIALTAPGRSAHPIVRA